MKRVLIVEPDHDLGSLWAKHISRGGSAVTLAPSVREASEALGGARYDALVIDVAMPGGSALDLAEFARYRHPDAGVIFVTKTRAYADGSIFALCRNASAYLQSDTPPEDLAAIVEYHAAAR